MASAMACQYPGCAETTNLERCGNNDGRLVCPQHRTLRNGSYVCVMCEQARAKAEAEEGRAEARRRQQAADREVNDFLRFGTISAGVVSIVMLFLGGGWFLLSLLLLGGVIASWVMSEGHRKGPLRDMDAKSRVMIWALAIVGAVIGVPVLIIVWIIAVCTGAAIKQTADEVSFNSKVDAAVRRADRY